MRDTSVICGTGNNYVLTHFLVFYKSQQFLRIATRKDGDRVTTQSSVQ